MLKKLFWTLRKQYVKKQEEKQWNTTKSFGGCLEYMKQLPDKSIDLIVTDPPYGKKADKGTNGFGQAKNRRYAGGWDSKRPDKEVFDEMRRISKNMIIFGQIILRTCCQYQIAGYSGIKKAK